MSKQWAKGIRVAIKSEPQYKGVVQQLQAVEADRGGEMMYNVVIDNGISEGHWFPGDALISETEAETILKQLDQSKEIKAT